MESIEGQPLDRLIPANGLPVDLNRHHPGWYHLIFFHHQYRKGEYEAAFHEEARTATANTTRRFSTLKMSVRI